MNCPYCGSQYLEESSNFNEYTCELCKCEFKHDGETHRTFEEGNYKKFCENVMYKLCEDASPKLSHVIVSVLSQLKNNGVEELDTVLEHLQLVSANVASEVAIGLNQETDSEVVTKGIDLFENLGNTLLKRTDLELDLSRLIRLKDSKAFYEGAYSTNLPLVSVKPAGGNMQQSVVAGAVDEAAPVTPGPEKSFADIKNETAQSGVAAVIKLGDGIGAFSLVEGGQVVQGFDSIQQLKEYIGYYDVPMVLYVKSPTGSFTKTAEGNPQSILKSLSAKPAAKPVVKPVVKPVGEVAPPVMDQQLPPVEGIPRVGGGLVGGVSDNLPGAGIEACPHCNGEGFDLENGTDMNPEPPCQHCGGTGELQEDSISSDPQIGAHNDPGFDPGLVGPTGEEPISPEDQEASYKPLDDEMLEALATAMAEGYSTGAISEEADFAEALMNCESANGLCEDIGCMSEEQVYEVARRTKAKLESMDTVGAGMGMGEEVTEEQLTEALDILSSSAKKLLDNEELKDL